MKSGFYDNCSDISRIYLPTLNSMTVKSFKNVNNDLLAKIDLTETEEEHIKQLYKRVNED